MENCWKWCKKLSSYSDCCSSGFTNCWNFFCCMYERGFRDEPHLFFLFLSTQISHFSFSSVWSSDNHPDSEASWPAGDPACHNPSRLELHSPLRCVHLSVQLLCSCRSSTGQPEHHTTLFLGQYRGNGWVGDEDVHRHRSISWCTAESVLVKLFFIQTEPRLRSPL